MSGLLCVLLSLVVFLSADAWGDVQPASVATAKVKKVQKCTFPKSRRRAPDWICNKHVEGLAVTAVGSSPKSHAGFSFMEKMAVADARTHLVQEVLESVHNKLAAGQHAANQESGDRDGASITRLANDALQNTKIEKRIYGPNGTLYVLVGLGEEGANQLIESVTAEYLAQQRK